MNKAILAGLVLISACTGGTDQATGETKKAVAWEGAVIAHTGLVLRDKPASSSAKVTLLPYGSRIRVLSNSRTTNRIDGISAPWLYCTSGTRSGWVFGGFVRPVQPGQDAPAGLALDRVPAILHTVFGKTVRSAIARFGQPLSARQSFATVSGMSIIQHELVWPGMTLGFSEAPDLETVHAATISASAPEAVRKQLDIGKPASILSNLLNPAATSIRSNLVSRSLERMQVQYTLSNGVISGFDYRNAF